MIPSIKNMLRRDGKKYVITSRLWNLNDFYFYIIIYKNNCRANIFISLIRAPKLTIPV